MRRAGSAAVIVIALVFVALVAIGVFYFLHLRQATPPSSLQGQTPFAQEQPQVTTATSTNPVFGFIYEHKDYTVDQNNDFAFTLYDTGTNASSVLKGFGTDFVTSSQPWPWKTLSGLPLVLGSIYQLPQDGGTSSDSNTFDVAFFDPWTNVLYHASIQEPSILSPNTSIAPSTAAEKVAYCNTDDEFVILDAKTGKQQLYPDANPVCYVNTGNIYWFSPDGSSFFYESAPTTETSTVYTSSTLWKLDLATGNATQPSLFELNDVGRLSPDQKKYIDVEGQGFVIRKVPDDVDEPGVYTSDLSTNSWQALETVSLPQGLQIGGALFSVSGSGVFYYTYTPGQNPTTGALEIQNPALGYYDIASGSNYFPLPVPQSSVFTIQLLGAIDMNHLLYQVMPNYYPQGDQSGTVVNERNTTLLYLQGVSSTPSLIDSSDGEFLLSGFLERN